MGSKQCLSNHEGSQLVSCYVKLEAVQVLLDKGVEEGKILFLSLIAAPEGVHKICGQYPRVKVITTEIDEGIAPDFQVIPGNAPLDVYLSQRVQLVCCC